MGESSFALRTSTGQYYIGVALSYDDTIVTLEVNPEVLRGRMAENTSFNGEVIVSGEFINPSCQVTVISCQTLTTDLAQGYEALLDSTRQAGPCDCGNDSFCLDYCADCARQSDNVQQFDECMD